MVSCLGRQRSKERVNAERQWNLLWEMLLIWHLIYAESGEKLGH